MFSSIEIRSWLGAEGDEWLPAFHSPSVCEVSSPAPVLSPQPKGLKRKVLDSSHEAGHYFGM